MSKNKWWCFFYSTILKIFNMYRPAYHISRPLTLAKQIFILYITQILLTESLFTRIQNKQEKHLNHILALDCCFLLCDCGVNNSCSTFILIEFLCLLTQPQSALICFGIVFYLTWNSCSGPWWDFSINCCCDFVENSFSTLLTSSSCVSLLSHSSV